ncbi:MAG: hypothetical protein AB7K68_14680 [Bacteriovoracia bacterium]
MKRAVGLVFGMVAVGVLLDRARLAAKAYAGVKKMEPDYAGNYDIDGVSYDSHDKKVVVGSDSRVKAPSLTSGRHQIECGEKHEKRAGPAA